MAHAPLEELATALAEASQRVEVGARYVHFKDPSKEYLVTGLAIMEADEEVAVIYEAQYGPRISFVRPLASFTGEADLGGRTVPRFSKIA